MTMFGIIAGTGFETLEELELLEERKAESPWGAPSAPVQVRRLAGSEVLFLSRHGLKHQFAPHEVNYRANIAALKAAGAEALYAVYTVGGITEAVRTPGTLVIPHDVVDYTWGREHSYSMTGEVIHAEFSEPFDARLRERLAAAARTVSTPEEPPVVARGVYAATQGPRLESPAEVDRLERDGCDVVGMTGMPEVGLARELELPIAGIACVVNPAAGRGAIAMDAIAAAAAAGRGRILQTLALAVREA